MKNTYLGTQGSLLHLGSPSRASRGHAQKGDIFFLNFDQGGRVHIFTLINFKGGSKFIWASERPQNGGKMTEMDKFEFKDIKWPAQMPKYGAISK